MSCTGGHARYCADLSRLVIPSPSARPPGAGPAPRVKVEAPHGRTTLARGAEGRVAVTAPRIEGLAVRLPKR
jgi:hypothetical protein